MFNLVHQLIKMLLKINHDVVMKQVPLQEVGKIKQELI